MAVLEKSGSAKVVSDEQKARLVKAQATRAANKRQEVPLTDSGRTALAMVQTAKRACDAIATRIRLGKPVTPEALRACGQLSTELAGLLVN